MGLESYNPVLELDFDVASYFYHVTRVQREIREALSPKLSVDERLEAFMAVKFQALPLRERASELYGRCKRLNGHQWVREIWQNLGEADDLLQEELIPIIQRELRKYQ